MSQSVCQPLGVFPIRPLPQSQRYELAASVQRVIEPTGMLLAHRTAMLELVKVAMAEIDPGSESTQRQTSGPSKPTKGGPK